LLVGFLQIDSAKWQNLSHFIKAVALSGLLLVNISCLIDQA
jgi:hypothetical protein